jgi:transposase-like protein
MDRHIISPVDLTTEAPKCPICSKPMRLTRVVPSVAPQESGVETQTFACAKCSTTVTRTLRLG